MLAVWTALTRLAPWAFHALARTAHRRQGADPDRLPERFGHRRAPALDRPVWFHGASIGEIAQIRRLAEHGRAGGRDVLITTGTATSAAWVAQHMDFATHAFAPVDTPRSVERFLDAWQPAVTCFAEGDMGPNMVAACKARCVPLALLNPRPSRTRARFPGSFRTMMNGFAFVSVKDAVLRDEFLALGVPRQAIVDAPDLKRYAALPAAPILAKPDSLVGVAASTHKADEAPVLDAFAGLRTADPDAQLIIVPRHPDRGPALRNAARAAGFAAALRSAGGTFDGATDVYVADTTGELPGFLAMADFVFMGGSFGDAGGHNPFEAAAAGHPILTGPHVANFEGAFAELTAAGAATSCADAKALRAAFIDLSDPERRAHMSAAAANFLQNDPAFADFLARFQAFIDQNPGTQPTI